MRGSYDILLRAGVLITQDTGRRILEDAGVAISGSAVAAIGPWRDFEHAQAGRFLDLSNHIVLPGLVNTHTHASMTVFRGLADDLPLMEWLGRHIWPAEARLSPEIVSMGASLACAEMLTTGTTTFCDLYIFERFIAETVERIGMRGVVGEGVFDTPNPSYSSTEQAFAKVDELIGFCRGLKLVQPCLVAHSVYATAHESLTRLAGMAEKHGLTLTLHAGESPAETAMCLERFQARPLEILKRLGLLFPRLLVAHAVDVTSEEVAQLAESGVKVAHNPRSNMKLASGMAPVAAMRRAGVTVGLGTDGAASNNGLNMFAEMNAAALLAKVRDLDPTALPAQAALDMATIEGARALGLDALTGSIEPGKQADIIALNARVPNLQPPYGAVSRLAYSASGGEVDLTMVAGRVLYQSGAFASIDYPGLLREMVSVRKWAQGA